MKSLSTMKNRFIRSTAAALLPFLILVLCPTPFWGGTGTFKDGEFDFCVSVRFEATEAQLAQIRTAFTNASQILADATDGQHRFGTIKIVNNSGASQSAEYWVNPGAGRAYATQGKYGVRGEHVMLYFDSNFQALNGANGDAYTIAHEHAHHAYGVLDEYSGPGGNAECAAPPDTADLNYCLMDNYFTRGGRAGGGSTYTLKEFCVAANHDPNENTWQHHVHEQSCWELIAAHPTRSANAPANLPNTEPPAAHAVTFEEGFANLRSVLCIDRSGSMNSQNRMTFARSAARIFVDSITLSEFFSGSVEPPEFALSSFSSGATLDRPLTTDTASIKSGIASLSAGGLTNIGGGLQRSLETLMAQPERSCDEVIILLGDGDHNTGTHPQSVVPSLIEQHVTVISVGLGTGLSTSGQQVLRSIATQTGGRYFAVTNSFDLAGLFFRLAAETSGKGLLANAPLPLLPDAVHEIPLQVEEGAASVTFGLAVEVESDLANLELISPSSQVITFGTPEAGVEFHSDANFRLMVVDVPEPGQWIMRVTASSSASGGMVEPMAMVDHDSVQLIVDVPEGDINYPTPLFIEATLRYRGQIVTDVDMTADITRPDGQTVTVVFRDDGTGGDRIPGDGIYAATFTNFSGEGAYTINVSASTNEGSVTFEGESLFEDQPSSSIPVPALTRTGTDTAIVVGAPVSQLNLSTESALAVNPQTGLLEQTVTVTNPSGATAEAILLTVTNLPSGARWYSSTDTTGNNLKFDSPLAPGDSVVLKLEYYLPTRDTSYTPNLSVSATTPDTPVDPAGTVLQISRQERRNDTHVIEFITVPGRQYMVQYRDGMDESTPWINSPAIIMATSTRVMWVDDGPPKTKSKPSESSSRFYRVILLPDNNS